MDVRYANRNGFNALGAALWFGRSRMIDHLVERYGFELEGAGASEFGGAPAPDGSSLDPAAAAAAATAGQEAKPVPIPASGSTTATAAVTAGPAATTASASPPSQAPINAADIALAAGRQSTLKHLKHIYKIRPKALDLRRPPLATVIATLAQAVADSGGAADATTAGPAGADSGNATD